MNPLYKAKRALEITSGIIIIAASFDVAVKEGDYGANILHRLDFHQAARNYQMAGRAVTELQRRVTTVFKGGANTINDFGNRYGQ